MRRLIILFSSFATLSVVLAQETAARTEMVRMRDGTDLATDIYLPPGTGKFPVLVCRTPYGKSGVRGDALYLAKRG